MGTKENVVAGGTILKECGANYLVVVDAPNDLSAPIPILIPEQITIVGDAIGYEVLWPINLVIIHTPILVNIFAYKTLLYNIFYFYIQLFNLVCTMVFTHEGISKGKETQNI